MCIPSSSTSCVITTIISSCFISAFLYDLADRFATPESVCWEPSRGCSSGSGTALLELSPGFRYDGRRGKVEGGHHPASEERETPPTTKANPSAHRESFRLQLRKKRVPNSQTGQEVVYWTPHTFLLMKRGRIAQQRD